MLVEEHIGVYEQVVEVHGVCPAASVTVGGIELCHVKHVGLNVSFLKRAVVSIAVRKHEMVLCHTDSRSHNRRLIHLVV